ncbi:hypothetical protein H4R27_005668 [Coemansia aciculifera]|nr:hypothetical protein H4R27_005668 [Coemansia aciculifera]
MAAQMRDRPFQVQCGWNGMVVIDAKVFRGDDGVRFRRSVEGECSASECSLICNDMWRKDFNRLVTVPRVKLTYELRVQTISFRPGPKKILCHPLNGVDTINPDGPKVYVSP